MTGPQTGRFERFSLLLAWVLPASLALCRASSHAQWRGDVGAVRDLALAGLGWGGGVSTGLAQLASLLPIGSQTFRTALISVVALAFTARAFHSLALSMLRAVERSSRLAPSRFAAPGLATIGTLAATVSPSLQLEATVGGSSMLAVAMSATACATVVKLVDGAFENQTRALVAVSLLAGALVGENALVALLTAAACGALILLWPRDEGQRAHSLPLRALRQSGWMFALGAIGASLPGFMRTLSPHAVLDVGGPYLWGATLPEDPARALGLLPAWLEEIGLLSLIMAGLGTATMLLGKRTRGLAAGLFVFALADALARPFLGPTEGARALRLLSFGWLSCGAALGVFWFLTRLVRYKVPFARAGAALVAAFQATVVALVVESSTELADRSSQDGAVVFTDLALEQLPPDSALLVDDSLVTWRLLAAQLVEGRRPDVLVIPRTLVGRGEVASTLLVHEPQLEPLLLSLAITGTSDELGLSELADARPLYVEPERGWDATVYSHLSLSGFWLRFQSEPLGPVERKLDVEKTLAEIAPLLLVGNRPRVDIATAVVATRCAQTHAKTLLRTGDVKNANAYLRAIDTPANGSLRAGKSVEVRFAAAVARLPVNEPSKKAKARVIDESKVPGRAAKMLDGKHADRTAAKARAAGSRR